MMTIDPNMMTIGDLNMMMIDPNMMLLWNFILRIFTFVHFLAINYQFWLCKKYTYLSISSMFPPFSCSFKWQKKNWLGVLIKPKLLFFNRKLKLSCKLNPFFYYFYC
jgi:hypothetical protein